MLKKIVLGAILVGFSGVLIYGAILRTASRSDITQDHTDDRRSQEGSGYEQEKSAEQRGSGAGRQAGEARGEGSNQESMQTLAEELPHDWLDQAGSVESVEPDAISIRNTQGDLVLLEGRALRFIQDEGMQIVIADEISLTGFFEDGEYKPSIIVNHSTGESLTIRDESGRPMWAGGRGKDL